MWFWLLEPYNLPPWKMMKCSFMIMSLLIDDPKAPRKDRDVYLRPLISELKDFWDEGVQAYNVSIEQVFQLQSPIMWTIHDFLAYGIVFMWSTKGYKVCHVFFMILTLILYVVRSFT